MHFLSLGLKGLNAARVRFVEGGVLNSREGEGGWGGGGVGGGWLVACQIQECSSGILQFFNLVAWLEIISTPPQGSSNCKQCFKP